MLRKLYIPLRSDKTGDAATVTKRYSRFISHYVQIKLEFLQEAAHARINFISHYVQIKLDEGKVEDYFRETTLYPTTFR